MRRRDAGDFAEFAVATHDQLHRTAFLLCGDWHRAADVVQEALIKIYVAWPRLEDRGLRSYARRAVTTVAFDMARKKGSWEVAAGGALERAGEDTSNQIGERLALLQALTQLPPRQRACVVLRYYDDLSVEEVAEVLGCRAGTVKSQTARGLAALRTAYAALDGELEVDDVDGARAP